MQYGEVLMVLLKTKPGSGESKGFGFIRFADKEVEKKVILELVLTREYHFGL